MCILIFSTITCQQYCLVVLKINFFFLGVAEERLDSLLKSLAKESVANYNLEDKNDSSSPLSSLSCKTEGN